MELYSLQVRSWHHRLHACLQSLKCVKHNSGLQRLRLVLLRYSLWAHLFSPVPVTSAFFPGYPCAIFQLWNLFIFSDFGPLKFGEKKRIKTSTTTMPFNHLLRHLRHVISLRSRGGTLLTLRPSWKAPILLGGKGLEEGLDTPWKIHMEVKKMELKVWFRGFSFSIGCFLDELPQGKNTNRS